MEIPNKVDCIRVLRWISIEGGEITRNRLRRYRPTRARWEPIELALSTLISAGCVEKRVNAMEPLVRGAGYPATRYAITEEGSKILKGAVGA